MLTAARALFRAAACLMILALAVAPAAARPWRVIVYRPLAPRVVVLPVPPMPDPPAPGTIPGVIPGTVWQWQWTGRAWVYVQLPSPGFKIILTPVKPAAGCDCDGGPCDCGPGCQCAAGKR